MTLELDVPNKKKPLVSMPMAGERIQIFDRTGSGLQVLTNSTVHCLLEQLTAIQQVRKFYAFNGIHHFITVHTGARCAAEGGSGHCEKEKNNSCLHLDHPAGGLSRYTD
jgi:hypothetical protein